MTQLDVEQLTHAQLCSLVCYGKLPREMFGLREQVRWVWATLTQAKRRPLDDVMDEIKRDWRLYDAGWGDVHNETRAHFYVHLVAHAVIKSKSTASFDTFLEENDHLLDLQLPLAYYTPARWNALSSRYVARDPDRRRLPPLSVEVL